MGAQAYEDTCHLIKIVACAPYSHSREEEDNAGIQVRRLRKDHRERRCSV